MKMRGLKSTLRALRSVQSVEGDGDEMPLPPLEKENAALRNDSPPLALRRKR